MRTSRRCFSLVLGTHVHILTCDPSLLQATDTQPFTMTHQEKEGFSKDSLAKSCCYVDKDKTRSPHNATYKVSSSRPIQGQHLEAETVGLTEKSVGECLSDISQPTPQKHKSP